LHIHDLGVLAAYCCGWDLQDLLLRGFGGVSAKTESKPPRHLRSALGQAVNFLYTLQGETAGAQAFSNFDTLLAPFARADGLSYRGIKQAIQEFVFNINVPTRVGFQSLVWDELVVVKIKGRIKVAEIGGLVDGQFERNVHRVLSQGNSSYAVANADDIHALAFDDNGQVAWKPIKAFVRHRVPKGSPFVRVRTSRGAASVSQAHSLFAFEELDGRLPPRQMTARDVDVVHGNATLTPTNHFVAVRQAPNGKQRATLDLVELVDAVPQIAARTRVRVPNPAQAVERLRQRVREQFGGFTPFYLEYGLKDKGCWKRWVESGTLPYLVWRSLGKDEPEAEFALRNSDLWYARTLDQERLGEFVRLLAWYITEGHNDITNGLYVSQAQGDNQEEMARVMHALGALGRIEKMSGWSAQGNPTSTVLRMAGKGLLAALIGYLGGTYSTNKVIPWFIYDLTSELQETFIATLIQGDGSEYATHYDYHTTSKKLSLGLSLLLAMNGSKFSVYETAYEQKNWNDQYILRIYKDKDAAERYAAGDLLARVCTRRETFAYEREYEYDLSVDTNLENFAGGSGLLCFHNTPFTNLTMDLIPPATLRDTPVIVGGELQDETFGDFQPEMDMINRAYAEIMLEGDARGRVFTFPIPTYNIFKEFDWDNPALKPVWQMTAKYGIPYFSNFINSDMKPEDARSMCPLSGRTRVIVRSKQNGIRVEQIIHIINNMQVKGTEYKVLTPTGSWVKARPVKVATTDVYRVWLSNGVFVDMGENHLQPTMDKGTLLARELAVDMWLPFTRTSFESELGDYDLGYVVGAYLGDGSHDNESTIYSLCAFEKDDETERRLARIWNNLGFFVKVTQSERNVRFLRVSAGSYTMLRRFVKGSGALDKSLTRLVFNGSVAFKSGILDGYQATDGSREKKRLYTASESLRYDMAFLLSSLGRKYNISSYDDREDRFSKNVVYRIDYPERANYGDFYKEDNDYHYYRITKIERLADFNAEHLYCFQVASAEHLFVLANGLVTHNCRLRLDNRELRKRGGGLFAANPLTGSIGVVTLNMARIGYLAENEEHFWTLLEATMRLAQKSLEIKRKVLNQFTEAGLYPYSKYYLAAIKQRFESHWANHFLTIAVNGMNECCLNFLGVDIFHQEARDFAERVLSFMRERIREFQLETDHLYNLEASPAESASFRLAKEDKARFPDIRTAGSDQAPYYTNSTHLPVNCTDDLFKALAHQDSLQVLYTGGTVFHGFLGEQIDDWRQARLLVRRIAENFHLPYFTLTPTFSICPVHGYLSGEHTFCPYEHTAEDLARFGVTI
jgi:ribonucleoside-triphosphate reductase